MSHVDDAISYAEDATEGNIPACKLVKLACGRFLDDLHRENWPYRLDRGKAERACKFIELLPHTKGKWARTAERIRLERWQKFILVNIFGWVREDGTRRFREGYIEVPRKNGKSIVAAGIGLYCFTLDGEFGAEVYSGATTEKQAWEVFRPARLMVMRTPALKDRNGIDVGANNMAIPADGSRFEPLVGNPGDGASPSCVLVDEYHEHATSELYDAMVTGMGAREQPLIAIITTAGVNLAGPCYEKRGQIVKILEGVIDNDEIFGVIYSIDEGVDWTTEAALRMANPNLGISVSTDYLISRQREAMQTASRQNIFRTKHLNVWCGAKNAWMNMQAWLKCPPRKSLEELAGRPCYLGLDLASKIDVAALLIVFPPADDDPRYHVHGRYYLPEDMVEAEATSNASHYDTWAKQGHMTLTPGNVIDYDYIMDDIRDLASRFEVQECAYDPWQATHLSSTLLAEGMPMVEVRATVQNFSEPMKEIEKLVIGKTLAHGNCPVLTWMASNVVARLDKKDNIYPNKEQNQNKIDGVVSLIMAMGRAMVQQDNSSVYEDRGIMVF